MKNKLFLPVLLLLSFIGYSQRPTRQLLRGHAISESAQVQDVNIYNISAKTGTVTDNRGYFIMFARAKDTLYFNSLPFRPAYVVLTEADLEQDLFTVRLDVEVTVLDEVIVTDLSGQLDADAKKTRVKTLTPKIDEETLKYPYARSTLPVNGALYPTESQLQGINFIEIGKMIFKPKKAKKDKGEIYGVENSKTFTEVAVSRFTDYFFTETLNIPGNEIAPFLAFCDKGKETRPLLDPRKEFELTDYLVKQADAYLKRKR